MFFIFYPEMKVKNISIQRIDQVLEKGSARLNEDCLLVSNNIFGVFDGASSLDGRVYPQDRTGGFIAANTARREFSKNHFPLHDLGVRANKAIKSEMVYHGQDTGVRKYLWSTSAAVIRIHAHEVEWLQAGDAHILFIHDDGSFSVPAQQDDHDYETLSLLKTLDFDKNSEFEKQIKKVRSQMNKTYGVLNGEPEASEFIHTGIEDLCGIKTILVFTDGLTLPGETPLKQKRFDSLVDKFNQLGLSALKDYIRSMEASDPDIRKYPRFKCHDDIAAIAVHLT